MAFILPWKVLFDAMFAARVAGLDADAPKLEPAKDEPKTEAKVVEPEPEVTSALQLLAILQREGRFIDFLQENVAEFSDADIGAAARVVHEGCNRGLKDYVDLVPVRDEAEGDPIELAAGYDAGRTQVTGNVVGEPPFRGKLAHHGWRVAKIEMPKLSAGRDPHIVAPAEVEL